MAKDPKWKPAEPEPDAATVLAHRRAHPPRTDPTWRPAGPDVATVLGTDAHPLDSLAAAAIPAIILRGVYPEEDCGLLLDRFVARGLMRDPTIPTSTSEKHSRVDIGTSLGNRGSDEDAFLAHAAATRELFETLFAGLKNPIDVMYASLAALAPEKAVTTARQADGRSYGPAIFRIHYGDHAYAPHFDHVRLRERRFNYTVSRHQHQFAGILCLQNDAPAGESTQTVLHRCLWTPEVQPFLATGSFHTYAAAHNLGSCPVKLNPGDLYFFNTQCIHEVPALQGRSPRVVLAVFIGYTPGDPEISVWS